MSKGAKSVGIGAATGAAATAGTWAGIGALGTASTGTAIAGLSGAAKTATVVAALGGPIGWLALGVGAAVVGGVAYAVLSDD